MGVYRAVWFFALLGLSVGVAVYMTQEVRSDRGRRQALTGSVAGAADRLALNGLFALVGQAALIIALLLALVSPPDLRGYRVASRRMLKRYRRVPARMHLPTDAGGNPISDAARRHPFDPGLVRSLTDPGSHQAWHPSTAAPHAAQHRRDARAQAQLALPDGRTWTSSNAATPRASSGGWPSAPSRVGTPGRPAKANPTRRRPRP